MTARHGLKLNRAGSLAGWRELSHDRLPGASSAAHARRRNRRRLVAIPALLALGTGAALGVAGGLTGLKASDVMPVRSVAVLGVDQERVQEVRAYAEVHEGAPLFGVDLDAVAARVREHPFVEGVTVRRVPPDGIEIVVREREPAALLSVDELYLVDAAGVPFKRARPGDGLDLPVITGLKAEAFGAAPPPLVRLALKAIAAYGASALAAGPLAEAHVEEGRGVTLVFDGGLRAELGDIELGPRIARLERALAELEARGLQASFLYLKDGRRTDRVAVRLKASAEVPARSGT